MKIFARHSLVDRAGGSSGEKLLLEGSWPGEERRAGRWSLDETIDARLIRLDRLAMELADRAARNSSSSKLAISFAYINALALRYYLVKLLRVTAFFQEVRPARCGEKLELHLTRGDEDYAHLFEQVARLNEAHVAFHWHVSPHRDETFPGKASWRRWAAHLRRWQPPVCASRAGRDVTSVVLCGNPRILNPICAELVARDIRVYWLYERFAARSWWRWRSAGVEQMVCDSREPAPPSFNDVSIDADLVADGVDYTRSVEGWLLKRAAEVGRYQSSLVARVQAHFRRVRPTALVVDEDATPLKRIAVASARSLMAKSTVVQHGAPCGPFGFLPLAADEIAVWGNSAREQLETWGVSADKIRVTGWPSLKRRAAGHSLSTARSKRFLLLATMPPRDERPDNVEFHLTSENYGAMLDMVVQVLNRMPGAALTIKPHPRDANWQALAARLRQTAGGEGRAAFPLRIVRSRGLSSLIADSDCILSCASTAGIEAALAGAPVIQLLPRGSGNVLPAEQWGLLGSARTADELVPLIERALARGWRNDPVAIDRILASHGREAAARVVDGLVGLSRAKNRWLGQSVSDAPVGECRGIGKPLPQPPRLVDTPKTTVDKALVDSAHSSVSLEPTKR